MSDRPDGSTVLNEISQNNRYGQAVTKEFDSDSDDSLVGEFELDDFDAHAAARQFDSQFHQQPNASARGELDRSRIVWVLRLLHATLQNHSSERFENRSPDSESELRGRLNLPEKIGRFRIGVLLGRGGFGEVYRGHDEVLHRDVALKVIPRREKMPLADGDYRLNEARAAARLNHPNLVPLYEVFEAEDFVYLVSELCDGPTLRRYLNDHPGPMDPAWAAEIVRKLADAIAHAHSRGLIHRDIKPGNVILVPESGEGELLPFSPRLTDFGLVLDTKESLGFPQPARLAGTILYMPPEALTSHAVSDARSNDVYSLGLLLYEMLSGQLPFQASTAGEILKKICIEELPPLPAGKNPINRDLQAICFRALAKQPQQRYQSVHALLEDLNRFRRGQSVSARPRSWLESACRAIVHHPQVSTLLAIVVGLVLVGTISLGQKNLRLQQQSTAIEKTLAQLSVSERHAVHAKRDAIVARDYAAAERDRAEANRREAIGIAYRSDLLMAFTAIDRFDIASAVSYLGEIDSYLDASQRQRTDLRLLKTLAHDGWESLASFDSHVEEIVLFPSQKWFAVADAGNRVRIYRAEDAMLLHEIVLFHGARIHALAVSPDESQMAVGASQPEWLSSLGTALSWLNSEISWLEMSGDTVSVFSIDVSNFSSSSGVTVQQDTEVQQRLTGFAATVDSLAFHPDGQRLAIGVRYEPVEVRWLDGDAEPQKSDSQRRNEDLSYSANGELSWLAGRGHIARQASDANAPVVHVEIPHERFSSPQYPKRLTCSADGQWMAIAINDSSEGWLLKRNAETQPPIVLENPHGELASLSFSPSCQYVAAGTTDGAVLAWQLPRAGAVGPRLAPVTRRILHGSSVDAIRIDDAGRIISGAGDGSVVYSQLAALSSAAKTFTLECHSTSADMAADGQTAVVGCQDGSIWKLDFATGEPTCLRAATGAPPITKVSIASSGSRFAVGDRAGHAWIGSLRQPSELTPLPTQELGNSPTSDVNELSFDDCSQRLVVRRSRSLLQWIDTDSRQVTAAYHMPTGIAAVGLLDCETAVTFSDRIYTVKADMSRLPTMRQPGLSVAACVCYDPREQSFYVGGRDGIVRSMNAEGEILKSSRRWKPSRLSSQTSRSITVIAISPDGQNLITGSTAGDCAIWDTQSLRLLGTIDPPGEDGEVEQIRFSADGQTLMIHQRIPAIVSAETRGKIQLIRIQQ